MHRLSRYRVGMSVKVRRGLGLLVVALIAFLVVMATQGSSGLLAAVVTLIAGVVLLVTAAAGLVLLAWGLLRD